MAGDWLKIELELPDKPEVHAIAAKLNLDPDAVVGKLIRVWQWFDKHTVDGNAVGVTFSLIDRISGVSGFGEVMHLVRWLEQIDAETSGLSMPRFDRHTSASAKQRALTAKRVAKTRNADGVTETLPEKKKEEKTSFPNLLACGELFQMVVAWQPSNHLPDMAKQAGIQITPEILQEFVSFWLTRPQTQRTQEEWDKALLDSAMRNKAHAANKSAKAKTNQKPEQENFDEKNYGDEVTTL